MKNFENFFFKIFFSKNHQILVFFGILKISMVFFLSVLVFHPKIFFSASEIYFCFLKKILDLIRSLHRSKIIKVGPPPKKGRFWGGVQNLYVTYSRNVLTCRVIWLQFTAKFKKISPSRSVFKILHFRTF